MMNYIYYIRNLIFALALFLVSCSSSDDTCEKPTNFNTLSIDENVVVFSYKQGSFTDYTVIEYGVPGFELGNNALGISRYHIFMSDMIAIGGDSKFHLADSFEPNTTYEAYIKSECSSNNYSEFYGPVLFTTLNLGEGCTRPDSLIEIEKTNSSILIDWEGFNKEDWIVEILYYEDGFDEYIIHEVSEKPFLIESLQPETTYYISVRTNFCEGILESSLPSNVITVTTNN